MPDIPLQLFEIIIKFIRKINVKHLMNNNKNSIIDNNIIFTFILYIIIVYKYFMFLSYI